MYREHHPGHITLPTTWDETNKDHERSRQASTCSERSCESMTLDETRELWQCMLELQSRYGCYNSTRIDMAVDAGEYGVDLMPNRFIIDTLNESVIDLPDEGRELLNRYLCPSSPTKQKWKFWKKE
jgi:CO dehydrogenase/acetyl-CoA synthase gamma subunit (corrinoid Fe-S protein)